MPDKHEVDGSIPFEPTIRSYKLLKIAHWKIYRWISKGILEKNSTKKVLGKNRNLDEKNIARRNEKIYFCEEIHSVNEKCKEMNKKSDE